MTRLAALTLALLLPALPGRAEEVVVFAAASLKTALDAVAADFTAATGHRVTISYAGSNALAQQILAGAPADLYISAAPDWMDTVEAAGLTVPGTRADILGNTLVLVAHGAGAAPVALAPPSDLPARLGPDGRLAMAFVDAVPAGQYGKAALQSLTLWEAVAPQVVQSDNVRSALAFVAMGEAAFGIVYASDAVAEPRVSVVATFPEGSHPPIRYPAALLGTAADPADMAFLAALTTPAARAIFTAQGFTVPE